MRVPVRLWLRRLAWGTGASLAVAFILYLSFEAYVASLPLPPLARGDDVSPVVLDERGRILTAYLSKDGKWRLRTTPHDVPDFYLGMLLAYEDKRFYSHAGVDPFAAMRAASQMAREGRIVSGASTITMQVARLLGGQAPGILGKLRQAALALKLERQLSKDEVLTLYLTLAPFGGNVEGVRMASLHYFGVEPRQLGLAEAALLIALPQSPERRRPDLNPDAARAARNQVLDRLAELSQFPTPAMAAAKTHAVPSGRAQYRFIARHLADRLRAERPGAETLRTLVDADLQARIEEIAGTLIVQQHDPANAAVVVVRRSDMAVRAYLGGAAYFDDTRAGMLDLVRAIRSPGSALKPVIYGMAFEYLIVHPETIVTDDTIRINGYAPSNFDGLYRGDLTVHDALIASINTVPVLLLNEIGPTRLIARLTNAGIVVSLPGDAPPGLAVAIGGVGIDLENMVELFAGLSNGGFVRPLRYQPEETAGEGRRLLTPEATWAVTDVLADLPPPRGRAPLLAQDGGRRIAYKTGTSYGFRDAWSVGYDAEHVVAVWVGRPDGLSRMGDTAATAAVPTMFSIFDLLPVPTHDVAIERPADSILSRRGGLPPRLQRYPAAQGRSDEIAPSPPLSISFPVDGTTVSLRTTSSGFQPLVVTAKGGSPPFHWFVDGHALESEDFGGRLIWMPAGPGQVTIKVLDSEGDHALSSVWLQ